MSRKSIQSATSNPASSQDSHASQLSPTALGMLANFFKVLSEVTRLQIVCALKSGPKNVSQIIEITGLGQANVSKHLKILTDARLLSRSQQGVNVVYEIANPVIFPLCDLVCNSLASQLQQQHKDLEKLKQLNPISL
ncbi:MAG: metalloregulator ArsR/SmtB family transcription factor [Snowella sp.]|nr:metalloregulator ArsR/SmtB family transcription factor [Snowella sp.]